jgi:hypothetical protein
MLAYKVRANGGYPNVPKTPFQQLSSAMKEAEKREFGPEGPVHIVDLEEL